MHRPAREFENAIRVRLFVEDHVVSMIESIRLSGNGEKFLFDGSYVTWSYNAM